MAVSSGGWQTEGSKCLLKLPCLPRAYGACPGGLLTLSGEPHSWGCPRAAVEAEASAFCVSSCFGFFKESMHKERRAVLSLSWLLEGELED